MMGSIGKLPGTTPDLEGSAWGHPGSGGGPDRPARYATPDQQGMPCCRRRSIVKKKTIPEEKKQIAHFTAVQLYSSQHHVVHGTTVR